MGAHLRRFRILVVALHFAPDMVSNSFMTTAIVEELARHGHAVTVVTAFPFHRDHRIEARFRGRLVQLERHAAGVRVVRCFIWLFGSKTNVLGRFAAYLSHTATTTIACLAVGRHDVVMAVSPPLTIGLTAHLYARLWRVPFV